MRRRIHAALSSDHRLLPVGHRARFARIIAERRAKSNPAPGLDIAAPARHSPRSAPRDACSRSHAADDQQRRMPRLPRADRHAGGERLRGLHRSARGLRAARRQRRRHRLGRIVREFPARRRRAPRAPGHDTLRAAARRRAMRGSGHAARDARAPHARHGDPVRRAGPVRAGDRRARPGGVGHGGASRRRAAVAPPGRHRSARARLRERHRPERRRRRWRARGATKATARSSSRSASASRRDRANLAEMRDALGAKATIMVDANQAWTPDDAPTRIAELAAYRAALGRGADGRRCPARCLARARPRRAPCRSPPARTCAASTPSARRSMPERSRSCSPMSANGAVWAAASPSRGTPCSAASRIARTGSRGGVGLAASMHVLAAAGGAGLPRGRREPESVARGGVPARGARRHGDPFRRSGPRRRARPRPSRALRPTIGPR